ncbi:hypothetical protein B0T19DRAFT_399246 [Cercophora scortea]|uniref:Xylanolytic transcriptional activator regulatory domain-containing protein n=1 Tax=Cercophora scortea TaxID=314031 RepID=A0AAE0MIL1_9PEZI|nr:hypothetical protein B0T19DRAFT_399246 [Cercophora scortea]
MDPFFPESAPQLSSGSSSTVSPSDGDSPPATIDIAGSATSSQAVASACVACCIFVKSRRGYKGPRRNKRQRSSSPQYPSSADDYAAIDSCPMLLGHTPPVSVPSSTFSSLALDIPHHSPAYYTATPVQPIYPEYRTSFVPDMTPSMASSMTPNMTPNVMALTTISPPSARSQVTTVADRCFDAFYRMFHRGHPFVLPKDYFLRLSKHSSNPNLGIVLAAMRYVGSMYVDAGSARETYLAEAVRECYLPTTPKDGFLVQALLLLIIGLDGSCQQKEARAHLAYIEALAIEIDLNKREFAAMHGKGNPILEESWRRTWWELFVCDGMIAGVHQITNFALFDIPANVGLPCEEEDYLKGHIPPTAYMEDFDDQIFSGEDREFSSFTYRIAAARNLGRLLRLPHMEFEHDENIARMEAYLTNWRMHLPESKRDDLNTKCQLDEMMFQAHFITHACSIMLHKRFSQIDTSPVKSVTSCAEYRHVASGGMANAHTRHTTIAASEISKMVTQAVNILSHTHFFTCVVTLSSTVHLSRWAMYYLPEEDDLRELIKLNIGALNDISKVWKAADTAWGQVQDVAKSIYQAKKQQRTDQAFWIGLSPAEIMSIQATDDTISKEFNI